ncbi:uncharacterized protein LOC132402580 isoform X1 [Hypanus sabinus]|uniref:uncharacterized protein LOC132402580 isoform X1 n=1 Tax=Hypanus sabinus TaxID=79690 RepID=UPI0028C4EF4F|nr:uncharacterized protein LOC132402580 isoform X1 [Hypanus sabinus]XP_059841455.1 uncharacterized protein LOC132402580 isoform X1 [Hypanus sabinus]XP_059841456.1 uncharacterized protein LOC132402580 isoform X1 [Hypanus sabinus]XP_059841457.1 uncharacterized protein LOC132402580 isoform X1 [Hypanus sabinus]XP_059841458.1 uncharacterized protein LOC132402580 isoform X1 [Hypanus sabinus]
MRFDWCLRWALATVFLPGSCGQSGERHGSEINPEDFMFPLMLNESVLADDVTWLLVPGQDQVLGSCSITLLTSTVTTPGGQQGADLATQEDLNPLKGLMDGTGSALESLMVAVEEDIGRGSYQSVISKGLLDIQQQNEVSDNIMEEIRASLEAQQPTESLLSRFKEKVGKMETMLHAMRCLSSQMEQTSDLLALELGKSHHLESALGKES